jgi:hypothetical protein
VLHLRRVHILVPSTRFVWILNFYWFAQELKQTSDDESWFLHCEHSHWEEIMRKLEEAQRELTQARPRRCGGS